MRICFFPLQMMQVKVLEIAYKVPITQAFLTPDLHPITVDLLPMRYLS